VSGTDDRLVDGVEQRVDDDPEATLRPRRLGEFLGQRRVVDQLSVFLEAARARSEACDHVLLFGPPGLGKTSLAHIIATEMAAGIHTISGPALERKGDMAAILTALEPNDVLFIDEIHRTRRDIEEILYPAMEDRVIDIVVGSGPGARTLRLDLAPFTLVGATTRSGMLTTPLRDRFGIHFRLEHYPYEDLVEIVRRSAVILGVAVDGDGASEIARRARGTPRIANRLLRRVRDYAQIHGAVIVDATSAAAALDFLQVDADGLDHTDRLILRAIGVTFAGGPVGLSTLAVALGEDEDTIADVYEPYLIQRGLIQRTPRGRVLTRRGGIVIGQNPPAGDPSLFGDDDPASDAAASPPARHR
jgi:holliday junction DNA helicase RuvB